jgi:EmrB/QacA subfamily drug resistance transporter
VFRTVFSRFKLAGVILASAPPLHLHVGFGVNQVQTWTLVAMILASGITFLDGSVVNVALPAIDRDLGAGLSGLQWIVDGYALTLSSFLIVGGALGDRLGRKRVMVWGLVGFGLSSLACGLAPSTVVLVAARLVQGAMGALLVPGSLAIIRAVFTDDASRAGAIGTWSAFTSVAGVVGPLLGGVLVDRLGWRWVFLINPPLVALTALILMRFVPESKDETASGSLDWLGAALVVIGLSGLSAGLIEAPLLGLSNPLVWGGIIIGVLTLVAFVWHQARTPNPMMPLKLFNSRTFRGANLYTLGVYFSLGGLPFFLPVYIQNVMNLPATVAGAVLLPVPILLFLFSRVFSSLSVRLGPRRLMTVGALIVAIGLVLMTRLSADANLWLVALPAGIVFGLGLAVLVAPLTTAVLSSVPAQLSGVGSAINNVASRVAGLLAVAGLGVVFSLSFNFRVWSEYESELHADQRTPQILRVLERVRANPTGRTEGLEPQLMTTVRAAQTDAFRTVLMVCAASCVLGAAAAWFGLREGHSESA